jgi:hypothetical protein
MVAWFAAVILLPAPARAEDNSEIVVDRIHSNLPLYTFDWKNIWPRSFYDEDGFGCTSRVAFGDWHFVPTETAEHEEEYWERFSNYGVFHCAATMRAPDDSDDLEDAQWEYGFFVRLGKATLRSVEWELWALQKGSLPGSEYTLLAREVEKEGLIEEFRVLQQRCPSDRLLEAEGLDIWNTRYCAINSRAELLSLGRKMLRLPPRGTMTRVPQPD